MIQSDPIWINLFRFDPIYSNLINFDQLWSNLIQFEPILSYFNQIINLMQFEAIWSNLISFEFSKVSNNKTKHEFFLYCLELPIWPKIETVRNWAEAPSVISSLWLRALYLFFFWWPKTEYGFLTLNWQLGVYKIMTING